MRRCAAQLAPARCLLPLPTTRALSLLLLLLLVALQLQQLLLLVALLLQLQLPPPLQLLAWQHLTCPLLRMPLLGLLLLLPCVRQRQTERDH